MPMYIYLAGDVEFHGSAAHGDEDVLRRQLRGPVH